MPVCDNSLNDQLTTNFGVCFWAISFIHQFLGSSIVLCNVSWFPVLIPQPCSLCFRLFRLFMVFLILYETWNCFFPNVFKEWSESFEDCLELLALWTLQQYDFFLTHECGICFHFCHQFIYLMFYSCVLYKWVISVLWLVLFRCNFLDFFMDKMQLYLILISLKKVKVFYI